MSSLAITCDALVEVVFGPIEWRSCQGCQAGMCYIQLGYREYAVCLQPAPGQSMAWPEHAISLKTGGLASQLLCWSELDAITPAFICHDT